MRRGAAGINACPEDSRSRTIAAGARATDLVPPRRRGRSKIEAAISPPLFADLADRSA
jgi:hypothetical protein